MEGRPTSVVIARTDENQAMVSISDLSSAQETVSFVKRGKQLPNILIGPIANKVNYGIYPMLKFLNGPTIEKYKYRILESMKIAHFTGVEKDEEKEKKQK